ncbi:hypothetical protein BDW59DRAFT_149160 [Aspergillus cavernicola]|uniref:Uncharacterized protein n=1 Tax=Aspergillus cavernicola TaxID=176166 RepID=A0ABR4I4U6_9EURO
MTTVSLTQGACPPQAASSTPLSSALELQRFLSDWMITKGESPNSLGDIQPLWKVAEILNFRERTRLLEILKQVPSTFDLESGHYHQRLYVPLPLTLATYMMGGMILSSDGEKKLKRAIETKSGDELLRYQIKAVRDSFLWLGDLIKRPDDWIKMLCSNIDAETERVVRMRVAWLTWEGTRNFCEKSPKKKSLGAIDVSALTNLWHMFQENEQLPIQFAFRLASLNVKGTWSAGREWSRFSAIVPPLL